MDKEKTTEQNISEENTNASMEGFTQEQQSFLRKLFFQKFPTKHYACRFPGETKKDHKRKMNAKKRQRKLNAK